MKAKYKNRKQFCLQIPLILQHAIVWERWPTWALPFALQDTSCPSILTLCVVTNLHVITSSWKLWMFIPPSESSFQSQQWGFRLNCPLVLACANTSHIQLVVTTPDFILIPPSNIIHAVIMLGLIGVMPHAIHTSIETNHQQLWMRWRRWSQYIWAFWAGIRHMGG